MSDQSDDSVFFSSSTQLIYASANTTYPHKERHLGSSNLHSPCYSELTHVFPNLALFKGRQCIGKRKSVFPKREEI